MYFPSVLTPRTITVRSVYRNPVRGSTIVYRDTYEDEELTTIIGKSIRRRPGGMVLQELLVTPPPKVIS